jgi:uracil-DNA glycosylase family 4
MKKSKSTRLKALGAELSAAPLPLMESNLVFGEGNIDCTVMFIGEAPGANEDRMKRPFVGRSGGLLDRLMGEIGWKRDDVYITNIVKRRPPNNRAPQADEIEAYTPYLARQITIIDPAIIVTLGRFAMNYFLPNAKISRDHGRLCAVEGRRIVPLYHPAAALRSGKMLDALRSDFKKLPDILNQ